MWLGKGVFARTTAQMTWPEILFYLTAGSDRKAVDDKSQSVAEQMVAKARESGKRKLRLEDLVP